MSIIVTYALIMVTAIAPIWGASLASIPKLPSSDKASGSEDEDDDEIYEKLTKEDALWFPVLGSVVLGGLFLMFKYLDKDTINFVLQIYFAVLGVPALAKLLHTISKAALPSNNTLRQTKYRLSLTKSFNQAQDAQSLIKLSFTTLSIATIGIAAVASVLHFFSKHWVLSNLFGLAFSFNAILLMRLDSFMTGMILLSGLFVYDIWWVFGTNVMVSVATNFEAPVKIVYPKHLGIADSGFSMLGLGDIVIPGIFVALACRFDYSNALRNSKTKITSVHGFAKPYFRNCMIAYLIGLVITVAVMHTFQAAQPALLYLSPACILSIGITAAMRGELKVMWNYDDAANEKQNSEEGDGKLKSGKTE